MATVDTVRTVFKTEWLGAGVVQNMVRQYGLAEKAIGSLSKAQSSGMASSVAAQQARMMASYQNKLAEAVARGTMTYSDASAKAALYKSNLEGVAKEMGVASTSASGLLANISPLTLGIGAAAVAVGGLVIAFKNLWPVLEEGSKIAQLDSSFQNLNATMIHQPELLDKMKEASRGTLTTMAAQEGFMTLVAGASEEMTVALADAAPKLLEISKAANKLNPALGDTNFMFTSLAKGVKRAEPRLIDNLGLKLRVSDANKTLAESLGKSVMELTAEEKQLALLNETLRAGDLLIAQVGGSVDGIGDSFQRAAAASEDFKNTFKEALALQLDVSGLNDVWATFLNNLTKGMSDLSKVRMAYREGIIDEKVLMMFDAARRGGDLERQANILAAIARLREEAAAAAEREAEAQSEISGYFADVIARGAYMPMMGVGDFSMTGSFKNRLGDFDPLSGLQTTYMWTSDWYEYQKAAKDGGEETVKAFEAMGKAAVKGKEVARALAEAREAWREYNASIGDLAEKHLEADRETSYFTASVQDLGKAYYNAGGPTKEQKELLEDLQDQYDKSEKKVRDLRAGIGLYGKDQEDVNKAMEKATGEMEYYRQKLGQVKVAEDDWRETTIQAKWNWDNIRDGILEAGKAAELSAQDFLNLALGLGETDEASANAALMATALESNIQRALQEVKMGKIRPSDAIKQIEEFAQWISMQDMEIILNPDLSFQKTDVSQISDYDMRHFDPVGQEIAVTEVSANQAKHDKLLAAMFGDEALEPIEATAELNTDPMVDAIGAFMKEHGTLIFQAEIEGMPSGGGTEDPRNDGTGGGYSRNASGGQMIAGMPTLVGEMGPELITPDRNAWVHKAGSFGGAITVNNYNRESAAVAMATLGISRRARVDRLFR